MRRTSITAGIVTTLALMAPSAYALPASTPENDGTQATQNADHGAEHTRRNATPGPKASLKAKRRAYGKYCQDQSKKHVEGEKGTAFSRCVTAMAKLAHEETRSARVACKTLSKEKVEGEKGTSFSRCVKAGRELLADQAAAA